MFERKIYGKLLEWKNESSGKIALLIEGARRVGKSTVAEEFARKEYKSYILIDFSRASKEVTGLFVTLMFKDKEFTENAIYEKLLSDKLGVNLGYLYENVVAQMLAANGHALYYHTFLNEKSNHNYEIDFLLSKKNKICPIEVKSSGYNTHKSLDVFSEKYSDRILEKYMVYTKDLKKDADVLMMPVYLVPFLK